MAGRVSGQGTGGIQNPGGTQIFLSLGSANHDEALFENRETFDIHRMNALANIAFGRGIHFCLGNRLAIIKVTIALETLTKRIPSSTWLRTNDMVSSRISPSGGRRNSG